MQLENEESLTELTLCIGVPFKISKSRKVVDPNWLGLKPYYHGDTWKIKKRLTKSDCDNSSRLLVRKMEAQKYILNVMDERCANECTEGRDFDVFDHDTGTHHKIHFKKWKSTDSYVMTGSWKQDFVKRRGLKEGDHIGMWCDGSKFYFKVLGKRV